MEKLIEKYKELQKTYGDPTLDTICGGGKIDSPDICLVFINPTARNLASSKEWTGLKYPWLMTKQIWKFLTKCGLFDESLNDEIQSKKSSEWTIDFCERVYNEVLKQNMYITNLAKCTQSDARHLPDSVYQEYKKYFLEEMDIVRPKLILLFGNQISSILLDTPITVSTCRQKGFTLYTPKSKYETYAVYYPVGNGFFNADKAVEDIQAIVSKRAK